MILNRVICFIGVKWGRVAAAPLKFFASWIIFASLALGSNYRYLNKIIAKMLHLSTEAYNNEQVSKVFRQNFS